MKTVIEPAQTDSPPEAHPYAHDRYDDFTYDPVIVTVYRWLQGMEDALNRREASRQEQYQA